MNQSTTLAVVGRRWRQAYFSRAAVWKQATPCAHLHSSAGPPQAAPLPVTPAGVP